MIRTLIQHSQRLAGLALLAAVAVTAPSAQAQAKKPVARRPATTPGLVCCRRPTDRIVEADKTRARQGAGRQAEQKEIFVKKPTGVSPKSGQPTIAVGEPTGSRRTKEAVEQKQIEAQGNVTRRRIEEPLIPQKTKDAAGGQPVEQAGGRSTDGLVERRRIEKPLERVIETDKGSAKRAVEAPVEQRGIAVGERTGANKQEASANDKVIERKPLKAPSGVSPKAEANNPPKRVVEAPGELGRSRVTRGDQQEVIELRKDSPKRKAKEAVESKKLKELRADQQGRRSLADGPQRTKDATGSPQRAEQKGGGAATPGEKQIADLRKVRKPERLPAQEGEKGLVVIKHPPNTGAADLVKKKGKAKADKTDDKRAEGEAPSLRKRNR